MGAIAAPGSPPRGHASTTAVFGWGVLTVLAQVFLASIPVAVLLAMTKLKHNHPAVRLSLVALSVVVTVLFLLALRTTETSGSTLISPG